MNFRNTIAAGLMLLFAHTPLASVAAMQTNYYAEQEIDFRSRSLSSLHLMSSNDFEHERVFLRNLTSQKFNIIKSLLKEALEMHDAESNQFTMGDPAIHYLSYSIDERSKRLQGAVDLFMYDVARTGLVVVERFGRPHHKELAPLMAPAYREKAERYWSRRQDLAEEDERMVAEDQQALYDEETEGMEDWELAFMEGYEGRD
ncbi:hypothetical protein [Candidatus Odyssella thessalonicensis]|uniref:hypothetical protein n=1 Tax=Candidatus Odyssella thessalonicensis TaxID=84647 RepID=UPI000225AC57|nr:hypothetical protein [Candidatus Odyssella thessalonicensis]